MDMNLACRAERPVHEWKRGRVVRITAFVRQKVSPYFTLRGDVFREIGIAEDLDRARPHPCAPTLNSSH